MFYMQRAGLGQLSMLQAAHRAGTQDMLHNTLPGQPLALTLAQSEPVSGVRPRSTDQIQPMGLIFDALALIYDKLNSPLACRLYR